MNYVQNMLDRAKEKFDNKFNYEEVKATKVTDKVTIVCPIHGKFVQELRVHLRSTCGCRKCSREAANKQSRKSQETFLKEVKAIHNNKYLYDKTEYLGDNKKIVVTCPIHGDFTQAASSHLQGCGCKKCAVEVSKENQKTKLSTLKERIKNLPKHIAVDLSSYINSKTPLPCNCSYHGPFTQTLDTLQKGKCICPKCANDSRGWNRSLYSKSPTTLYLLKLNNGAYKIGITKTTIQSRYGKELTNVKSILFSIVIEEGTTAWDIEKRVLKKFSSYKYKGPLIFKYTGNSEVLTINPINFIKRLLNEKHLI